MSCYHSDKCSKEELTQFKKEVFKWFEKVGIKNPRNRALRCYNGEVRVYTGDNMEFENKKSSFRKTEPNLNDVGIIIGWKGTRGYHKTKVIDYIPINRDEFKELKKEWNNLDTYNCDVERLKKLT